MRTVSSFTNKLSGLYNNRRGLASRASNILGTAKSGLKLLGRTNEFVKRLGVSSPQLNNAVGQLQRYADPTIDFVNEELKNVA